MKTIRFVHPTKLGTLYNAGEMAGFEETLADHLVQQGFAEFLSTEEVAPPTEEVTPPKKKKEAE